MPFFKRTEAGRNEIRTKAAGLSRSARTLLLVIDDSQPPEQWIAQVRGSSEADLRHLSALGLIEGAGKTAPPPSPVGPDARDLVQLIQSMPYAPLYESLNGYGKKLLGVIGGYKFALDVERCAGPLELQAFATKFVARIREEHGIAEVRRFAKVLEASSSAGVS